MIYRRAFVRESAGYAASTLGVIGGVLALVLLSRLLGDAAGGALPPSAIGGLLALALVKYAPQALSLALFAGTLLALGRAFRDREMIAWQGAGIGLRAFAIPAIFFALPLIVLIGWLALEGSPWALRTAAAYRELAKLEARFDAADPGVFGEVAESGLVYIFERREGGSIADIFIAGKQGNLHEVVLAGGGHRRAGEGPIAIVLEEGKRYRVAVDSPKDDSPPTAETLDFSRYTFFLGGDSGGREATRLRALSAADLAARSDSAARAEMIWRIGLPLSALMLALLALPLARAHPRTGKGYGIAVAVFAFWIYQSALGLARAWVGDGTLIAAAGLIFPHALAAAAVLPPFWFVRRRMR